MERTEYTGSGASVAVGSKEVVGSTTSGDVGIEVTLGVETHPLRMIIITMNKVIRLTVLN
jgi:hypothetical protein